MQHPSPSKERPGRGRGSPRASIARIGAVVLATLGVAVFAPGAWPLASGESAPACSAQLLDGDRSVRLADYHGKGRLPRLLGIVVRAVPRIISVHERAASASWETRACRSSRSALTKTADEARRFLARYPAQFATALDAPGACPAAYRLEACRARTSSAVTGLCAQFTSASRGGDKTEIRRQVIEALAEGK